jgi:hypothetical protein
VLQHLADVVVLRALMNWLHLAALNNRVLVEFDRGGGSHIGRFLKRVVVFGSP